MVLRKRIKYLQRPLRGHQIELGYGWDRIRLQLSMDGRLLPRVLAYLYDPRKR